MRYIKKYESFGKGDISYFDTKAWENLIPKTLKIKTDTGSWILEKEDFDHSMGHSTNVSNVMNCVQIDYHQNTSADNGEPDHLSIDITLVKENDGTDSNPDTLRLNVDITYGDAMVAEFTIDKPKRVKVYHYTGIGSKHDSLTFFGFEDESLEDLIRFFNAWGYSLEMKDMTFIDKYPDTYVHNN